MTGGDIDEVLVRLRADPWFREEVRDDPAAALSGYRLSASDLGRIQDELGLRAASGTGVTALFDGDPPGSDPPAGGDRDAHRSSDPA